MNKLIYEHVHRIISMTELPQKHKRNKPTWLYRNSLAVWIVDWAHWIPDFR